MNDFYAFGSKYFMATFAGRADIFRQAIADKELDKAGKIMDDLIKGNYSDYTFPLVFRQADDGKRLRDVLDMRHVAAYLISDRLKNLLEENQITGWKSYPIELYDKKGKPVPGYNGFSFSGRAGAMNLKNQPIVEIPYGISGKLHEFYAGGYFDVNTWDGSDFFILEGSYWVIVTKKVFDLLKKNKVTALEFCKVSELELPCSTFKK